MHFSNYEGISNLINFPTLQPGHGHLGGGTGVGPAGPARTEGNSPHVVAQPAPYGSGAARDASRVPFYTAFRGTSYDPHRGHVGAGYDAQKGHGGAGYEGQRVQTGASYDPQRGLTGPGYDAQRGPAAPRVPGYEAQRGHRSETQKGPGFEMQRSSGDEIQRGANYDAQKGATYDASSRGTAGPQGQVPMNNLPYPPTPSSRGGTGYDSSARGVNPVHR